MATTAPTAITTSFFEADMPALNEEQDDKFQRWRTLAFRQSGTISKESEKSSPKKRRRLVLVAELQKAKTVQQIQNQVHRVLQNWKVEKERYRVGWIRPLSAVEFKDKLAMTAEARAMATVEMKDCLALCYASSLAAVLVAEQDDETKTLEPSLKARKELLAFIGSREGADPRKKRQLMADVPPFPRVDLNPIELLQRDSSSSTASLSFPSPEAKKINEEFKVFKQNLSQPM